MVSLISGLPPLLMFRKGGVFTLFTTDTTASHLPVWSSERTFSRKQLLLLCFCLPSSACPTSDLVQFRLNETVTDNTGPSGLQINAKPTLPCCSMKGKWHAGGTLANCRARAADVLGTWPHESVGTSANALFESSLALLGSGLGFLGNPWESLDDPLLPLAWLGFMGLWGCLLPVAPGDGATVPKQKGKKKKRKKNH